MAKGDTWAAAEEVTGCLTGMVAAWLQGFDESSRTAILCPADYEETAALRICLGGWLRAALLLWRSGRQPGSKSTGGPARSRAVCQSRRMAGGPTVHGSDGLAVSAGARVGRASARRGDHRAVSRRRQVSGLGPHARLGGPLEGAGRAGPVQGAGERNGAQHHLRHRGRGLALAGWRHGESRAGGQDRPARFDRLRGTLRRHLVLPGPQLHPAQ